MKEIEGCKGYFVTEGGEVHSMRRFFKAKKLVRLKPMLSTQGYLAVDLRPAGGSMKAIHRIVAETFLPNRSESVNHINGDKLDNRVENLEWCTMYENQLHHFRVLKRHTGDAHWNMKLTAANIIEARRLRASGMSQSAIAAKFGVSQSLISIRCNLGESQ